MNRLIEALNRCGDGAIAFAKPLLMQTCLLIVALLVLDFLLRRRARAVLRSALWVLILVKLLLPPSLALPTGLGYWLTTLPPAASPPSQPRFVSVVNFGEPIPLPGPSRPQAPVWATLRPSGTLLLAWGAGSGLLLGLLIRRSGQVARLVRQAGPAGKDLESLLAQGRHQVELRPPVSLRLSSSAFSPAVCGLWRPVVLLPRRLSDCLPVELLRAVLLHELIHVKRRDVWVNCLQTLLQVVYWWHPGVWLANARIRRVREEAVDEAVMVALGADAETYPATLLEVAKLARIRPLTALGLVGIFESKGALHHRIRRLLDGPVPRSAKLNLAGILAVVACGALLLPMARGNRAEVPPPSAPPPTAASSAANVLLDCELLEVTDAAWQALPLGPPSLIGTNGHQVWSHSDATFAGLSAALSNQPGIFILSRPRLLTASGVTGTISVTRATNINGQTVQLGPVCELTPVVRGTDIDLAIKASVTEMVNVEGDGEGAFALNAAGYVSRELAHVRVTVPDHGNLTIQNPGITARAGRHLVLLVKPVLVRDDAEALAAADRPTPEASATDLDPAALWVLGVSVHDPPYSLDGRAMTLDELKQALAREISGGRKRVLHIRAGNDVPLASLQKVLDAAQAAGVTRVSLRAEPHSKPQRSAAADTPSPAALETRIFRVDPTSFIESVLLASPLDNSVLIDSPHGGSGTVGVGALDLPRMSVPSRDDRAFVGGGGLSGITSTNRSEAVQDTVRRFFTAAGVSTLPPNQLYFSDCMGLLMVRASPQELGTIQKAIDVLNVAPPQLTMEAQFIEAPEDFVKRIEAGTFASSGDESNVVRILTASQARAFAKEVKTAPGVDVLAAPGVTTLSGRPTQVRDVQMKTIVSGVDPRALAEPGLKRDGATNAAPFLSQQVPLGPRLDLTARVQADGHTVELEAMATVTEFLGYDKATNTVRVFIDGKPQEVEPPLPRLRTRQANGTAVLYDGQSLLLVGPAAAVSYRFVDKVPVLGDLPLVGRLFRSEGTSQTGRHVLILIRTTLIDPAGNPIHSEGNLPFDPKSVPLQ